MAAYPAIIIAQWPEPAHRISTAPKMFEIGKQYCPLDWAMGNRHYHNTLHSRVVGVSRIRHPIELHWPSPRWILVRRVQSYDFIRSKYRLSLSEQLEHGRRQYRSSIKNKKSKAPMSKSVLSLPKCKFLARLRQTSDPFYLLCSPN